MKVRPFIILLISVLVSCGSDSLRPAYVKPNVKYFYSYTNGQGGPLSQGDTLSDIHYLMLSSYDERNFNDYNFVYLADQYLDTVKHHLPIQAIHFCEPFDFGDHSKLSEDDERKMILEHSVVEIEYDGLGFKNTLPTISRISIWTNGKRKDFDYLTLEIRRQAVRNLTEKK
jgi:hypothetical protein